MFGINSAISLEAKNEKLLDLGFSPPSKLQRKIGSSDESVGKKGG